MDSKSEELFKALLNGKTIDDFTPRSRLEEYLKAALSKSGTNNLPIPRSRLDVLLYELINYIRNNSADEFLKTRNGNYLFYYCSNDAINPIVEKFDFSNITDATGMFNACTSLTSVSQIDTSNVTNMCLMFNSCSALTSIPQLDTSKVTNMGSMFRLCSKLTSVPQLDTSNVTNMSSMFNNCKALTSVPQLDTSNVTDMTSMFDSCKALTSIPQLDTSNVTKMRDMFNSCSALTSIPQLDTSNVTDMTNMFYRCSALTSVPQLDTSNVTDMGSMFNGCSKLETISGIDLRSATSLYSIVSSCQTLKECWFKNIRNDLQVGSGSTYGHLLTLDCLLYLIKEVIKKSTTIKLTVGTTNLAKLSGIYVKLIDITDEMRAEDEFIDQKYPFEVCESTDEGAMTLSTYYGLKNLTLA